MSVLIDLPEDLFIEILQEWLQAEQIGLLDSSCCNQYLRYQLLKQVKTISVTSSEYKLHFYDWIYLREIKLKSLQLVDDCFHERSPTFKVRYEHIQKIHLAIKSFASAASNFINACPNLTSLEFDYCGDVVAVLESICNLGKITHVVFKQYHDYEIPLKIFAQQCTQLRSFKQIRGYDTDNYEHLYKQLFLNNPMLTVIGIDTSATISLKMIRECCPNIEILSVNVDKVDAPELLALLAKVKQFDVMFHNVPKQIVYDKDKHYLELYSRFDCDIFEQVAKAIKGLKTLDLTRIKLSVETVDHLSSSLVEISLCLTANQVASLQLLLTRCKQLHTVHIETSNDATATQFVELLHNLQPIAIRELYMTCDSISANNLISIMRSCKGLKRLDLDFCYTVSDGIIEAYKAELHKYDPSIEIRFSGWLELKINKSPFVDFVK